MSERGISKETLLSGLRDIRLPDNAPGGLMAELLAVAALAIGAALLLSMLLRAVSLRRKSEAPLTLSARIEAFSNLPEDERRVALLHLLKAQHPERYRTIKQSLYKRGSSLNADQIAKELANHV